MLQTLTASWQRLKLGSDYFFYLHRPLTGSFGLIMASFVSATETNVDKLRKRVLVDVILLTTLISVLGKPDCLSIIVVRHNGDGRL